MPIPTYRKHEGRPRSSADALTYAGFRTNDSNLLYPSCPPSIYHRQAARRMIPQPQRSAAVQIVRPPTGPGAGASGAKDDAQPESKKGVFSSFTISQSYVRKVKLRDRWNAEIMSECLDLWVSPLWLLAGKQS